MRSHAFELGRSRTIARDGLKNLALLDVRTSSNAAMLDDFLDPSRVHTPSTAFA